MLAVTPHYQSGQIKLLSVYAPMRLPSALQIPTLTEADLEYVRFGWLGICIAEGTPQPIMNVSVGKSRRLSPCRNTEP